MTAARVRTTGTGERAPMFRSCCIASFDVIDHLDGMRASHISDAVAYRRRVEADYRAVRNAGVLCVRESIGWRSADRGDRFDFASAIVRAQCAHDAGLQVVWTLCHSEWPVDTDVVSPAFVERAAWEDPRQWRARRLCDVLLRPAHGVPRVADSAYEQALRDVKARIDPLLSHSHHRYSP